MDKMEGWIISSADQVEVTFSVSRVWKGSLEDAAVVTTVRSGASCGFEFEDATTYLVYAYGEENELTTNLCTRTTPLVSAEADLAALGEGIFITETVDVSGEPPIAESIFLTALFIGLLLYRRRTF